MKKPNRKSLEKQCEKLWTQRVRDRDSACRNCNSDYVLQAHHIRSRAHTSTRYDVSNGLLLCRRCHFMQKVRPEDFYIMVLEIIGKHEYERLKRKSQVLVKHNLQDLIDIRDKLKEDHGRI